MFKSFLMTLFVLALILGLGFVGLTVAGYQVNPQNIVHYKFEKDYCALVKKQNRIHPLISKKNGAAPATAFDKALTGVVRTVTQADKFETFDRLKKDIKKVQGISEDRAKIVDSLSAS